MKFESGGLECVRSFRENLLLIINATNGLSFFISYSRFFIFIPIPSIPFQRIGTKISISTFITNLKNSILWQSIQKVQAKK